MVTGCQLPTETPPPPPGFTLDAPPPVAAAPPPPPGFALDKPASPPAPAASPKPSGDYDIPTQATRAVGKAAIGIIDFIPDLLTYAYNAAPLTDKKSKLELPSSYLNRKLDEQLTPPQTTSQKVGEEVSAAMIGGAKGAVELGGAALPGIKRGVQGATEAIRKLSRVETRAAEEAHLAGIDLPPSYIGGEVRKSLQTVAGGPKLDKEFSKTNAPRIDNLAKLALGLHPQEELVPETFKLLKEDAYKPYEKMRALGDIPPDPTGQYLKDIAAAGGRHADRGASFGGSRFPEITAEKAPYLKENFNANDAVDEIRVLRDNAKGNLRDYNPAANALGLTQREIANALENRLDRHASEAGLPDLLQEFRAARTQLAKIANVEDSIGAGGHVRAADFAKMLDNGMPLTDSLKTIGETAKHFPRAVQELTHGDAGSFSAVDYLLGSTGIVSGNPAVALPIIGRPISRWALKTEGTQKAMISALRKEPSKAGKAVGEVAGEVGKTVKAGAKAAARGGAILGTEDIEDYVNRDTDLEQLSQ